MPDLDKFPYRPLKAEIIAFNSQTQSDEFIRRVTAHFGQPVDYNIFQLAAGAYYVIFATHDYVEATDGTEHNS